MRVKNLRPARIAFEPVRNEIIGTIAFVFLSFIYDGVGGSRVSKFVVNLRKVSNRTHPSLSPGPP